MKKLLKYLAMMLLLGNLSTPFILAEEIEDPIARNQIGNVYSDGNATSVDALEAATGYNLLMHYQVTYNILKSELGTGKGESSYNSLYYGQDGGAFGGGAEDIIEKLGKVNTNPTTLLSSLSNEQSNQEETESRVDDDGGLAAGDSAPTVNLSEEEMLARQEKEKTLRKEAANQLASELMPVINHYYGLDKSKLKMMNVDSWSRTGDGQSGFIDGISGTLERFADYVKGAFGGSAREGQYSDGSYTRLAFVDGKSIYLANQSSIKNNSGAISANKSEFQEDLAREIESWLSKGRLIKGDLTDREFALLLQGAQARYEKRYESQFIQDVSGFFTFYQLDGAGTNLTDFKEGKKIDGKGTYERHTFAFMVTPEEAKTNASARTHVEKIGLNYLTALYYTSYKYLERSKDTNTSIKKERSAAFKKTLNEGKFKELLAFLREESLSTDGVANGNALMSWTPFYAVLTGEGEGIAGLLKTASNDKYNLVDNTFKSEDGKLRPVLAMDVFINPSKLSPILYGTSGSGVTTLRLGHENGSIQTYENSGHKWIGASGSFDKVKLMADFESSDDISSLLKERTNGQQVLSLATGYSGEYGSSFNSGNVGSDAVVGMDNYGNILNGTTGDVYVPYWQVDFLLNGGESSPLSSHFYPFAPSITGAKSGFLENRLSLTGKTSSPKTTGQIKEMFGVTDGDLTKALGIINNRIHDESLTLEQAQSYVKNGVDGVEKEDAVQALALIITANTSESVQAFNSQMRQDAKEGGKLFLTTDNDLDDAISEKSLNNEALRWTAAAIIQKLGQFFDGGIGELIRTSATAMLGRMYNADLGNGLLSNVFYTDTVSNSERWSGMVYLVTTILGFVGGVYLIILGVKSFRGGRFDLRLVLVKFLVLAGVVIYPAYIYGPLVNFVVNQPSDAILSQHMKVSAVLDAYLVRENNNQEISEYYKNTFGNAAAEGDLQLGSHLLTFYTTMDKDGFDINKVDMDDPSLSRLAVMRLKSYREEGFEYPKDNLVAVKVPLLDLYAWVWDVSYGGDVALDSASEGTQSEGTQEDANDTTVQDGSDKMLTYAQGVGSGQVKPLFEWLAGGGSSRFPVEGYQSELAEYQEYGFNQYQRFLKKTKTTNNAFNNILDFIKYMMSNGYEYLTASQLFYEVVYAASQEGVNYNLSRLHVLAELFNGTKAQAVDTYVLTDHNKKSLIRDLSVTSEVRSMWYGDRGWSYFVKNLFKGSSGEITTSTGETKKLPVLPDLEEPQNDFLGLTSLIDRLTDKRDDLRRVYYRSLGDMVYETNAGTLKNYVGTYAITRASLVNVRNEETLSHAEKMVVATEAYFQLNQALRFSNFPSGYTSNTVSFDKYFSLLFVPFVDYGRDVLTFIDSETAVPRSTAEYIAFKENILGMTLFMLAVISVLIFGIVYTGIFYFGLLIYTMYNFIKYYVVKADYQNKSWLGSLYVILSLAAVKFALMLAWAVGTYTMNRSVALSTVYKPSYPTTLVHSLVVIVIVWGGLLLVVRPTIANVLADKENIGGQRAMDGFGKFLGRSRGGRGLANSSASKFNKGLGNKQGLSDRDKQRSNQLGRMGQRGLDQAKNRLAATNNRLASRMMSPLRRDANMVRAITSGLSRKANRKSGSLGAIDVSKINPLNYVQGEVLKSTVEGINGLGETVHGLAVDVVENASNGALIHSATGGVLTTVGLASASSASILAGQLASKGIRAVSRGRQVLFDSSGYDLSNVEVRKELFGSSLAGLVDVNHRSKLKATDAVVKDQYQSLLYRLNSDGQLMVNFGSGGLEPSKYEELFRTTDFRNSFIRPDISPYLDTYGNVSGWVPLQFTNTSLSLADRKKRVERLFRVDDSIRKKARVSRENNLYRNVLRLKGEATSLARLRDNGVLSRILEPSMLVQGDQIRYDKSNPSHVSAIEKVKREIQNFNAGVSAEYGKDVSNLAFFIAKDGENQGLPVLTEDMRDNPVGASVVYQSEKASKKERLYKVDSANQERAKNRVEALNRIRQEVKENGSETLSQFTKAKQELIQSVQSSPQTSSDISGYLKTFLRSEKLPRVDDLKKLLADMDRVDDLARQKTMSESEANALRHELNQDALKVVESLGLLDQFALTVSKNESVVSEYQSSLRALGGQESSYQKTPVTLLQNILAGSNEADRFQFQKGLLVQQSLELDNSVVNHKDENDLVLSYLTNRPLNFKRIRERRMSGE